MKKYSNSILISNKTLNKFSQHGSTLIEAVVAIFIMSFGILALMLAQINSVNVSINSANQSEVTRAVQNYVEEMRAKAKISLKEEATTNGTPILISRKNYSDFQSAVCTANLNLNLINDEVTGCTITDGLITVQWGDQLANPGQSYTYKLQAGQE